MMHADEHSSSVFWDKLNYYISFIENFERLKEFPLEPVGQPKRNSHFLRRLYPLALHSFPFPSAHCPGSCEDLQDLSDAVKGHGLSWGRYRGVVEERRPRESSQSLHSHSEADSCLWVHLWLIVLKVDMPQMWLSGSWIDQTLNHWKPN